MPYLMPILQNLTFAFQKYQLKNMLILYDAIGTLAEAVGSALNKQEYIDILMPQLIQRWQSLKDDDRDLFPLLECLSSVTPALGHGFIPFAGPVFARCIVLISNCIQQCRLHGQNPNDVDMPDKDFMIVALDLLSGLVQGLGGHFVGLMNTSNPPLLQLLHACLVDEMADVRQSAYALLGDLAISCFDQLKPHIAGIMHQLIPEIDPESSNVNVCNNAAWAAGEIALKLGPEIQPYVKSLLERLIALLNNEETSRTLAENAAITIGRLGLVCPNDVCPHLGLFAKSW